MLLCTLRNDAVATALGKPASPAQCTLQYLHKSSGNQQPGGYHTGLYAPPSPEGDNFTECHPWKESSCCHSEVVTTPKAMNEMYGPGYHWNRCDGFVDGYKMSEACERFFVQEACLYECDPHAGDYRRYTDGETEAYEAFVAAGGPEAGGGLAASDPVYSGDFEHNGVTYPKSVFYGDGVNAPNKWQMYKMPIKASYCDAFYTACMNDYFCGSGDFWACSADYKAQAAERAAAAEAAALTAALAPFSAEIQAEVRNMTDVTSSTAAEVAQELADRQAANELALQEAKNALPDWAVVLIVALVVLVATIALFVTYIVRMEQTGSPLFSSLGEDVPAVKTATAKA